MNEITTFQKPGDLMKYLERGKSAIAMALPKHLNPDRMLRLALTCFSTNPKLRECSAQSILSSIVVAAQVGLEPGVAGQGYLIPYKGTCTFVPGWQGLVGLLNNTGKATAWTGAVFEGDVWDFQLGSNPRCHHIPGENYGDVEKMQWVYACGKVNGSEQPVVEAWPIARVWKHRDRFNNVGNRHYSYEHPEMYARKVVLLQVLKYMPRSIELNNAIVAANAAENGATTRVDEGVIIEMPAEVVTPAGRIGTPVEETTSSEEASAAPKPRKKAEKPASPSDTTPEPDNRAQGAPTDDELREIILKRIRVQNIGKNRLMIQLKEMGLLPGDAEWDALDIGFLSSIDDSLDDVIEKILNP